MSVSEFAAMFTQRYADEKRQVGLLLDEHDDAPYVAKVLYERGGRAESLDEMFSPEGSSAEEVDQVRELWGGSLPPSFEAYLLLFGVLPRAHELPFWLHFPTVLSAKKYFVDDWHSEVSAIRGPSFFSDVGDRYQIPEDAYHLGNHGGGLFYFVLENSGDPEVFVMDEGVDEGSATSSTELTFSETVMEALLSSRRLMARRLPLEKDRFERFPDRFERWRVI